MYYTQLALFDIELSGDSVATLFEYATKNY